MSISTPINPIFFIGLPAPSFSKILLICFLTRAFSNKTFFYYTIFLGLWQSRSLPSFFFLICPHIIQLHGKGQLLLCHRASHEPAHGNIEDHIKGLIVGPCCFRLIFRIIRSAVFTDALSVKKILHIIRRPLHTIYMKCITQTLSVYAGGILSGIPSGMVVLLGMETVDHGILIDQRMLHHIDLPAQRPARALLDGICQKPECRPGSPALRKLCPDLKISVLP